MQRTSRLLLILVAALGFDAAAISAQTSLAATDPASRAALLDSVGHARARWESARPQLYRVRVDFLCECARPLDNAPWVLVRGDSILRDSVRADQRPLVVARPGYYTVDGLFAVLETALRDTLVTVTGVRFDPTLGTPLSFGTRLRCVSRCSTGGWTDVHVLGFETVRDGPRTTPFLLLPLMDTADREPHHSIHDPARLRNRASRYRRICEARERAESTVRRCHNSQQERWRHSHRDADGLRARSVRHHPWHDGRR